MNSIRDYAEIEYQKDLISQLIKQSYVGIPEEEFEELTELIFVKLHRMNDLRSKVELKNNDEISNTAEAYSTSEDKVIDSFIYLTLIVENVILSKKLKEYIEKEECDD